MFKKCVKEEFKKCVNEEFKKCVNVGFENMLITVKDLRDKNEVYEVLLMLHDKCRDIYIYFDTPIMLCGIFKRVLNIEHLIDNLENEIDEESQTMRDFSYNQYSYIYTQARLKVKYLKEVREFIKEYQTMKGV